MGYYIYIITKTDLTIKFEFNFMNFIKSMVYLHMIQIKISLTFVLGLDLYKFNSWSCSYIFVSHFSSPRKII